MILVYFVTNVVLPWYLQLAASKGAEVEREILEAEYSFLTDKVGQLQEKVNTFFLVTHLWASLFIFYINPIKRVTHLFRGRVGKSYITWIFIIPGVNFRVWNKKGLTVIGVCISTWKLSSNSLFAYVCKEVQASILILLPLSVYFCKRTSIIVICHIIIILNPPASLMLEDISLTFTHMYTIEFKIWRP